MAGVTSVLEVDASKLGRSRLGEVGASVVSTHRRTMRQQGFCPPDVEPNLLLEVVSTSPGGHAQGGNEDEPAPGAVDSAEASRVDGDAKSKRCKHLEEPVEHAVE